MPNWCMSTITITGNKDEIKVLNEHFENARKHKGTENGFGEGWLGNIVEYLGLDYNKVPCRGSIDYYNYDETGLINLDTCTAWAPIMQPILMLKDRYAPSCDIVYVSNEPGCGIYISNDPEYYGNYFLDICDDRLLGDEDLLLPMNKDDLKSCMEDLLSIKEGHLGFNQLLRKFSDEYDVFVSQYEYCDIYDL